MLADHGYRGLNMDKLAEAIEYSKGTIYLHFASKEDLIAGLAADTARARFEMFRRGSTFNGTPREKMSALAIADEVFVRLYPNHFAVENLLDVDSVFERASAERQQALKDVRAEVLEVIFDVVREAIDQGDLVLPEGVHFVEPIYALWIQAAGHYGILAKGPLQPPFDGIDPIAVLWKNRAAVMDGYGWKPLSHEYDEAATRERVRKEIFADDLAEIERIASAAEDSD